VSRRSVRVKPWTGERRRHILGWCCFLRGGLHSPSLVSFMGNQQRQHQQSTSSDINIINDKGSGFGFASIGRAGERGRRLMSETSPERRGLELNLRPVRGRWREGAAQHTVGRCLRVLHCSSVSTDIWTSRRGVLEELMSAFVLYEGPGARASKGRLLAVPNYVERAEALLDRTSLELLGHFEP
jgi:hypothetical protein